MEKKVSTKYVDYLQATDYMENIVEKIYLKELNDQIWFLEHNHIYTAGTSAKDSEFLNPSDIILYHTGRGGKYTYHGPGQLIVYFMLDLRKRNRDIRKYIYDLEELIILSLKSINVNSFRRDGRIGIWVYNKNYEKKIAAIGVRIRKWISYHGIALNINPNLDYYKNIIPCGIKEFGITSLSQLNINISKEKMIKIIYKNSKKIFG